MRTSDAPLADRLNSMLKMAGIDAEVDCTGRDRVIRFSHDADLERVVEMLAARHPAHQ